jgi:hypothetical protein
MEPLYLIYAGVAERETQGTQNPPGLVPVRVRIPPPAPIEYHGSSSLPPTSMRIRRVAEKVWWETTTPPVLGKEVHQKA